MKQARDSAAEPKRILITGAGGAIGQCICPALVQRGHFVRAFHRSPLPEALAAVVDEAVAGDLIEGELLRSACDGMDAVIHLAAYRNDADFLTVLLEPNVIGAYHICEAARSSSVWRLILGSSVQAAGNHSRYQKGAAGVIPPHAENHYGLTKGWMETMGEMYARAYGLSVINARIGWFARSAEMAARIGASATGAQVYVSHRDIINFFLCAVESETPLAAESVTLYATSIPPDGDWYDPALAADAIGFARGDQWPQGNPYHPSGGNGS